MVVSNLVCSYRMNFGVICIIFDVYIFILGTASSSNGVIFVIRRSIDNFGCVSSASMMCISIFRCAMSSDTGPSCNLHVFTRTLTNENTRTISSVFVLLHAAMM
jgi:hypothetical protein